MSINQNLQAWILNLGAQKRKRKDDFLEVSFQNFQGYSVGFQQIAENILGF